jgi:hypothetical protein
MLLSRSFPFFVVEDYPDHQSELARFALGNSFSRRPISQRSTKRGASSPGLAIQLDPVKREGMASDPTTLTVDDLMQKELARTVLSFQTLEILAIARYAVAYWSQTQVSRLACEGAAKDSLESSHTQRWQ